MNTKISLAGSILNNHVPLGSFNCAKYEKKSVVQIQRYGSMLYLCPKWPTCPEKEFFSENPLIHIVLFIHAYLHLKNQS